MIFKNSKVYDVIKWVALVALPAFTWFFSTVLPLYGVSDHNTLVVVGTVDALSTLVGILAGVSSVKYANAQKGKHEADGNQ